MKRAILYNPTTGQILGKLSVSDPAQLVNYHDHIEVDEIEFISNIEAEKEVDVQMLKLGRKILKAKSKL